MVNSQNTKSSPKQSPKKQSKPFYSNKVFLAWVTILFIIIVAVFVFRSWVRVTIIPRSASLIYSNGAQSTLAKRDTELQQPFNLLGITKGPSQKNCSLELAQSIHTQIDCSATIQGYTKLPTDKAGQAKVEAQTQNLQNLLLNNGWQGGSNGVTLTSLVNGVYQGKDYSPDAYYEKVTGNYDCVFDVMIAYANPQPPAISATLSCDRTINIMGTPSGEFYNSSKGHL